MRKKRKSRRGILLVLIVFVLVVFAYLGFQLFSVTGFSRDLTLCKQTYGYADNQYYFTSGKVLDYDVSFDGGFTKVVHKPSGRVWRFSYPRSTPASPSCGTLINPDGSSEPFGARIYYGDWQTWYGCPVGAKNFPLGFNDGKLVAWRNSTDGTPQTYNWAANTPSYFEGSELIAINAFEAMTTQKSSFAMNIPRGLVNLSYDQTRLAVFVGQDVKFQLRMKNDWDRNLEGDLYIDYLVETPFGNSTKTISYEDFVLPPGGKNISVTIPTKNVADRMYFKARFKTAFGDFTGFPESCRHKSSLIKELPVREFDTDWQLIVINPKPLFLPVTDSDCKDLSGYESNKDKSFCIRDDLASLSCMQIGCPVFKNLSNEYFCTSAGICAEMVYKYGCRNDSDCTAYNAKCVDSNDDEKFCVKTEITKEIQKIEIPKPIYVERTCAEMDFCGEGYDCVDQDFNGIPIATCIKKEGFIKSDVPYSFYVIGTIVLLVIVILVFAILGKKKRGKR